MGEKLGERHYGRDTWGRYTMGETLWERLYVRDTMGDTLWERLYGRDTM